MQVFELKFGSDPNKVDVYINDPYVSPLHLLVHFMDYKVYITDLGSTNGTWIGNKRVTYRLTRLFPSEVVTIGRTKIPYGRNKDFAWS